MALKLWAYDIDRLDELQATMEHCRHNDVSNRVRLPRVDGQVAILPLHGVITQRGEMGGTSTQGFEAAFQRAIDSDRIGAVVIDVDSPGGTTSGVSLAADRVFRARGGKPVVAVANSLAASAAYWIASAADSFVAAPGADVGSIGVFRMHEDHSEAMAREGIKVTFISTPEHKVEANPFEPLSQEAIAHHTDQIQSTFGAFNGAVARHRGVTPAQALDNFGRGRTFHAEAAAKAGMIDRVASMPRILSELGVGSRRNTQVSHAEELQDMLDQAYLRGIAEEPQPSQFPINLKRAKLRLAERQAIT